MHEVKGTEIYRGTRFRMNSKIVELLLVKMCPALYDCLRGKLSVGRHVAVGCKQPGGAILVRGTVVQPLLPFTDTLLLPGDQR